MYPPMEEALETTLLLGDHAPPGGLRQEAAEADGVLPAEAGGVPVRGRRLRVLNEVGEHLQRARLSHAGGLAGGARRQGALPAARP